VTLRPLAPYALGRNRAAGAEVVELKPELAAYFDVEGGVLVVEVAPGTPAARAGLRPGDVLTRVGGVDVASMGHVRAGLAQPRDSVPVRLVRKGTVMEVVLRR
jgi:S1-C subfamily serine protease